MGRVETARVTSDAWQTNFILLGKTRMGVVKRNYIMHARQVIRVIQ